MKQSESVVGAYLNAVIQGLSQNAVNNTLDGIISVSNSLVSDTNIWLLLNSPLLSLSDKCSFLDTILKKVSVSDRVANMFSLIIKNKRLSIVPLLSDRCQTLKNEINGIRNAYVTAAVELDDSTKAAIEKELQKIDQSTLSVSYAIDESLLAGFKVRLEGYVYDLSFKSVLADLQANIAN